jgi:hypothetical protein
MQGPDTDACTPGDQRPAAALEDGSCVERGRGSGATVRSLRAIAAEYKRHHRRRAQRELADFRTLPTDEDAISRAALAQLPNGRRHPHQYRIPRATLGESRRRLLDHLPALRQAESFDELFELITATIEPIPGIGPLAVYDTALRVGARFGLEPVKVYLHAGTRTGAKALGLDLGSDSIEMGELPAELRTLTAREVEDVLCIYKGEFRGAGS